MAIRTARPLSFEGGLAYGEYDYDDTTGQVLVVRGVNDSAVGFDVHILGTPESGNQASGVNYSYTFAAGSGVTEWSIPQGQRKRFILVPDGGDPDRPDYYPTLAGLYVSGGTILP